MKRGAVSFAAGLMVGALVFGGTAVYAAGVLAERSNSRIFVNGQEVQLEAYLIDGKNYVQLREVGQAVGFNVYWDGAVRIDSSTPYTGEAPATKVKSTETTNSTVFNSVYTKEAFLALRQVVSGAERSDEISMAQETLEAMQRAAAAISEWPGYQVNRNADGNAHFSAKYSPAYEEAAALSRAWLA